MRCAWAAANEIYFPYHDKEWGAPTHDDVVLLEFLNLEAAQAGLSWLTVLKKREAYRKAFDNYDAKKISKYGQSKFDELMNNARIIRNRLKINAFIENAKAFIEVQKELGSFDKYIWGFSTNKTIVDGLKNGGVELSEALSKDLKSRGFKFVGPTICYALLQATGIINDHEKSCFRFKELT